jgi:predicted small secreted protein
MKKIIFLILLVLSIASIFYVNQYEVWPYNYHVANLIEQLSLWIVVLFIINIFAISLDIKKYKIWLIISIIFAGASLLLAYNTGDGNGAIVSFDGEMQTWFLSGLYSVVSIIYFVFQYLKTSSHR